MKRFPPYYPIVSPKDPTSFGAVNENFLWVATELAVDKVTVTSVTTSYSAIPSDHVILVDTSGGNITITLPSATRIKGKVYRIKRVTGGGNSLTIATADAATIDGAASISLPDQWDVAALVTDGTNWFTLSDTTGAPLGSTFVVMSLSGTLTAERQLAAGSFISLADGGANSTATLSWATTHTDIDNGDSPYTILSSDTIVMADTTAGNITINLLAFASAPDRPVWIKNTGAGEVTIDGNGAETIDGAATLVLAAPYESVILFPATSEWAVLSRV